METQIITHIPDSLHNVDITYDTYITTQQLIFRRKHTGMELGDPISTLIANTYHTIKDNKRLIEQQSLTIDEILASDKKSIAINNEDIKAIWVEKSRFGGSLSIIKKETVIKKGFLGLGTPTTKQEKKVIGFHIPKQHVIPLAHSLKQAYSKKFLYMENREVKPIPAN